ncbi:3'(2'),5'-bisphosphate nucleotidase CysQ [Methylosinus sp. Ce-a6]|uniref:3'(2'),5'-bisphosphate nucleotidase CysQ n=1 Tax=Methylosinus sp. Ce-a6 TaxID=2172005 RepID=UPI00135C3D7E|nr:3'(2'),5'-bisphosphate nucleotidase CysQ [Methylosinus sp. Ce-a6]
MADNSNDFAPTDLAAELPLLEAVARRAGEIAMAFFRPGEKTSAAVFYKEGGSPVTEADMAVDRFLQEAALALFPDAGWLSEETADNEKRLSRARLLVVDPIDGTQAFLRGDARWAVSIALIDAGRPTLGVIHAPALEWTFAAAAGRGAALNGAPIRVTERSVLTGARLEAPRGLAARFAGSDYKFEMQNRTPSLALRVADVASGRNDLTIASADSKDWDIAAADVILTEAGGVLSELEGVPLRYNRPQLRRDMLIAAPRAIFPESLALARAVSKGVI